MTLQTPAPAATDISSSLKTLAGLVSGQLSSHSLANFSPAALDTLCVLAGRQGLAPLLYRQLQQEALLSALPQSGYERLLAAYAQTAGYNILAFAAAQEWTRHLHAAGISGIWLKGLPLSLSVYPTPDTRPMVDIDVLVPVADREAALRLAESMTGSPAATLKPDQAIHAVFQLGQGERVKMELHWSLIAPSSSRLAPELDWFYSRTMLLDTEFGSFLTLAPEAHLLYLCAHAQLGHGESQLMLVRYLDMHYLIGNYNPLDWDQVIVQAARFRWTYAVERALWLAQAYFGSPIPEEALASLAAHRPADEDLSLVQQRSRPGTRWDRLRVRMQGEERTGQARLALALLFPPPAYIRWRYQVAGWKVPFYYPYRWFDALREIARSQ